MRFAELEVVGVGLCGLVSFLAIGDWLAPAALVVLWLCVKLVTTNDNVYALPIAICFHWSQTSLGVFYSGLTGRTLTAIDASDYRPMVMIALGCCLALAAGIKLGVSTRTPPDPAMPRPGFAFGFGLLALIYAISIFVEGSLQQVAPQYPTIRQILTTIDTARLGVFFLLLRRLCSPTPRWAIIGLVVGLEVVLGITGFFAGFREPVVLAALAVMEVFDRRNRQHWIAVTVALSSAVLLGLVWMGIRGEYRREYSALDQFSQSRSTRINRVRDLTSGFLQADSSDMWRTADALVERLWTVYYPALALERVPKILPHTNGAIVGAALRHIVTPRVFFPDKPELPSDSDSVRKYSNVHVAGRESDTSIAFGYSIEAYIDFGLPWMFLPVLAFGFFVGFAYATFRALIWHRELFVALATVTFWLSVYLFERSWATMLGTTMSLFVYLGPPIVLLDRFLLVRFSAERARAGATLLPVSVNTDRFI
jgi:hypothetical protein